MRKIVIGGLLCVAALVAAMCPQEALARRIRVRSPGGGKYTYYGPGGRSAARAAARRYYAPVRRELSVQEADSSQQSLTNVPTFRAQQAKDGGE